jgi:hypothetical protein
MNSKHLLVLACVAVLGACQDQATPAAPAAVAAPPAAPSRITLAGTVVASNRDITTVFLQTPDALVPLEGSEAIPMTNVLGADVEVRGTWDGAAVTVESFLVLAVNGNPALDGILESMSDGYAIRLVDGTRRMLEAAPAELLAHIGARVWVTRSADDAATIEFGVIQDAR